MTRYQDHGHEHCDEHCIRPRNHGWGQCEGRGGERWHLKCPRCDERESIVKAIESRRDDIVDNAFRCGLDEAAKIARGDA